MKRRSLISMNDKTKQALPEATESVQQRTKSMQQMIDEIFGVNARFGEQTSPQESESDGKGLIKGVR
jgi:hypothetical protein